MNPQVSLDVITPGFLTLMVKNWHTTVAGLGGAILIYLVSVGFAFPTTPEGWQAAATAIAVLTIGGLAKSQNVASIPQSNDTKAVTLPTAEALTATVDRAKTDTVMGAGAAPLQTPSTLLANNPPPIRG